MSADPVPTLDAIAADPTLAMRLDAPEATMLLAQAGGVVEVLRARLAQPEADGANGREPEPDDRLLTPEQVGERLGLSVRQVYARASRWCFTRRPSPGTLRFSEAGLERFMAGKKG